MNQIKAIKCFIKQVFLGCLLVQITCTSVYQGRTIGKDKLCVETTFGGPILTDLGFPTPVPNLFTGLRYGLRNDLDLAAQYNIFAPIVPGIPFDLITSASWFPFQPGLRRQSSTPEQGWGGGGTFDIQWITNFKNGVVILPSIDLAGSYRFRWISCYMGSAVGLNFYRIEENDSKISISPFIGFEWITSRRLSIGLKFSAYDLFYNYNGSQAHWIYMVEKKDERKKFAPIGVSIGIGYEMKRNR